MTNQTISTNVSITQTAVEVAIRDPRPEALASLAGMTPSQQGQLAHEAWLIGYRAVTGAHRLAEEARLNDIGKTLLADIDGQLRSHAERQAERTQGAFETYFAADSGQLAERLRQFVGDGGTLPALLERHLGPQNSVLVETLVKHVGEQSPLFKKLSPTDSEGLLQLMSERLRLAMDAQNNAFQKALDPQFEGGAISRFIVGLRNELKSSDADQANQLKIALAALDPNKEDSLLSQLRRDTKLARDELAQAINPSVAGSPLAIIHSSLTERLEGYAKSQQEQLEDLKKAATEHQRDVREAVNRIEVRRTEDLRSTRGGRVFEDAVLDFVQRTVGGHGYMVENTGSTAGIRPACKVGDAVIRFPAEHAFSEARIVIEAKCDKSYSVPMALAELELARANRGACAGIFVMAKSRADAAFRSFGRYGQDVLVIWDDENPVSDPYLEAALMVALGLAVRHRAVANDGDLQAMQKIEERIAKEVERLVEIRGAAEKIRKQVEVIDSAVESGSSALQKLLKDAKKTLCALKVELNDDQEERASPILLSPPANDQASVLAGE